MFKRDPNNVVKAIALLKRLADFGGLRSPYQFNNEGGGYYAVKAGHIRLFGWFCSHLKKDFVIGHAGYKGKQKLDTKDKIRMKNVKEKYESQIIRYNADCK
ncbi:MAG: hypothetical protein HQL69_19945 [Magnetococcales bacterium]|nr:hypothetical protein [Magnetococcales bacterium]